MNGPNRKRLALSASVAVIACAVLALALRRAVVDAASPAASSAKLRRDSAHAAPEPPEVAAAQGAPSEEPTRVTDASTWHEPPRITDPDYPIARLRDQGFRANDAGKFVNPRIPGVVYATDPMRPEAADTLALLMLRLDSCIRRRNSMDACIERMPPCQAATPWLGDPAGPECLPRECAIAYKKARATEDDLGAIETMFESHCYPLGQAR